MKAHRPERRTIPGRSKKVAAVPAKSQLPVSSALPVTETRHPRSLNLDRMAVASAVELMLEEDAAIPVKILRHKKEIIRLVQAAARAWKQGGRLFYMGAGTSGRLGVLDASECPPTFNSSPEMVQGIIAGGDRALRNSIEGAEDDPEAGAAVVQERRIDQRDVVVGIAASGTTPYVWGALREAKLRGATTALLCFNPHLRLPRAIRPRIVIAVDLGPEILTGSTRLKAGTATKLILNMITTLGMVRIGKVISNLMVDVRPTNTKLRARAVRILRALTDVDESTARQALMEANWDIKAARRRLSGQVLR